MSPETEIIKSRERREGGREREREGEREGERGREREREGERESKRELRPFGRILKRGREGKVGASNGKKQSIVGLLKIGPNLARDPFIIRNNIIAKPDRTFNFRFAR